MEIFIEQFPILKKECVILANYWNLVEKSEYAGLNLPGIGRQVPNLACLAYQCHTQLGGNETLNDYVGVGSDRNKTIPIPLKIAFKTLVKQLLIGHLSCSFQKNFSLLISPLPNHSKRL